MDPAGVENVVRTPLDKKITSVHTPPRGAMVLSAVWIVVFSDHTHLLFLAIQNA